MRARDCARDLPTVRSEDPALTAARLIASRRLPGIAVVDADCRPVAVLPAPQVLRVVVRGYMQEDPPLARVVDEAGAERGAGAAADVRAARAPDGPADRGVAPKSRASPSTRAL